MTAIPPPPPLTCAPESKVATRSINSLREGHNGVDKRTVALVLLQNGQVPSGELDTIRGLKQGHIFNPFNVNLALMKRPMQLIWYPCSINLSLPIIKCGGDLIFTPERYYRHCIKFTKRLLTIVEWCNWIKHTRQYEAEFHLAHLSPLNTSVPEWMNKYIISYIWIFIMIYIVYIIYI